MRRAGLALRVVLIAWGALAGGAGLREAGAADDYPTRPVKFVVPFAPGSAVDLRARQIAQVLTGRLGQNVIVDNRPGASGALGAAAVAKSRPDGYTLLACTGSTHGVGSAVMPDLGYDPLADFAPVARWVSVPVVLAVHAGLPARNVAELVQLGRARPGQLRYGTAGNASTNHVAGALFARRAGLQLTHVPYKGDGPALADVVAGHIEMLFAAPLVTLPHVASGRLRILAVAGPQRLPALPEVPTLAEAGIADSEYIVWAGLCAPAGTPPATIARLNRESAAALAAPDVRAELERQGYEAPRNTPEEFGVFLAGQLARARKLVQELNLRAEP